MTNYKWLNLQLFAGEGAGDGGAEGADSGVSAVDAEQQKLLELGVPADKLRKRANRRTAKQPQRAAAEAQQADPDQFSTEQTATANNVPTEELNEGKPAKPTWDEIKADPDYNKEIQAIVQARLRDAKSSKETLDKLTPALEVLLRKYDLDPTNPDYDALTQAISNDNDYYETKALELGVPLETAKKIDQQERATARQQRQEAMNLEQQKIQQHLQSLEQQGEALKRTFPKFDLRTELQNPTFARLTAPGSGLSVEDAYYAIHRKEIQTAAMQATAKQTAQKLSNSILAGGRRPVENGTSSQAPSVTTFDYRAASKTQRDAFKADLRAKWARGEKVYPGQR